MHGVEEIEAAILNLAPEDYGRLVEWFRQQHQHRYDQKLDNRETDSEQAMSTLLEWPPGDKRHQSDSAEDYVA